MNSSIKQIKRLINSKNINKEKLVNYARKLVELTSPKWFLKCWVNLQQEQKGKEKILKLTKDK